MTTLMAEYTARSAIGIAAKVPAETEADSVAADKEAGTKSNQKTILELGVVFLYNQKKSKRFVYSYGFVIRRE